MARSKATVKITVTSTKLGSQYCDIQLARQPGGTWKGYGPDDRDPGAWEEIIGLGSHLPGGAITDETVFTYVAELTGCRVRELPKSARELPAQ